MIEIESFIDLHTHTRYPDRNEFEPEEIEKASVNGGYSEILAMPNSNIVIDSISNLKKATKIDKNLEVNVHRVGALTQGLEGKKLVNFKDFINEGIFIFSDDGMSLVDNELAEIAFKKLASLGGAIFQHCEKNCHINPGDLAPPNNDSKLITINEDEEVVILSRDLKLVEKYNTRYHVQHISTKKSMDLINKAKEKNLPVTCEVTPHHLLLNNENLDISDGTFKMYPPIRDEKDRLSLVEGLKSGIIDVIATDHAPHPKENKKINFKNSSRGVVGLESSFPMLYSSKLFSLDELNKFLTVNPRKILKDLGYNLKSIKINKWKECNKEFETRTKYNNSAFENKKVLIEKV